MAEAVLFVVARAGQVTTLIEIAPGAGTDSLGQLLVYKRLWMDEHAGEPSPNLMLITDVDRPDIRSVAQSEGAEMIVV